MSPVVYRLRCVLRSRWRTTIGLTAVVAVVGAVVLVFAAGAQRTASAPDRFTDARDLEYDVAMQQERGLPRLDELRALPSVETLDSATFVFGGFLPAGSLDADGRCPREVPDQLDGLVFAGDYRALDGRLLEGRDANPAVRGEFVASVTMVQTNGLALGQQVDFCSLTQEDADRAGFVFDGVSGPAFRATLVGIIDGPADNEDPSSRSEPIAVFPYSLFDESEIGMATSIMGVKLAGDADLQKLQEQVDGLDGSESFILDEAVLVGPLVRTAVNAQSRGLWLLAAVSAVAAVAALGQVITRQVRLTPAERTRLAAIGFTEQQIVGETVARAAVSIVAGALFAVVFAFFASDIFPTGFARNLEPSPGRRLETSVLVPGALAMMVALASWTLIAVGAHRLRSGAARPSPVIEGLAVKSPSATMATGLRFAFTRGERDVGSVRTSVGGLLMTIVGLVAAFTFAASLQRLVTDPARYGENYDGFFGSGQTAVSDELREALTNDPDIEAVTLLSEGQARNEEQTIRLIGMEPVKGNVLPPVLSGRLPIGDDEIALGRLAARGLDVEVGDELKLTGAEGERTFTVTGLAVVPTIGSNEGVGQDGLVTFAGLQSLDPEVVANTPIFDLRPGSPPGTLGRILTENGAADTGGSSLPSAIENIRRVRTIPYVLAGLLGALALLTIGHVMVTSIHNRRRDVAIVRALGADRRWITRAVHWQVSSYTVLPIVVGTPLGLVVGHLVFRGFADSIGTVNDASLPFLLVAALVAGIVGLANVIAVLPARRARRLPPGVLLQAE